MGGISEPYLSPEMDKLISESVLFDNFFSNNIHTGHGLFNIISGIPNPPGVAITKTRFGEQERETWAKILSRKGYETFFFTTHDATFDNMEGFMRASGFQNVLCFPGLDPLVERRAGPRLPVPSAGPPATSRVPLGSAPIASRDGPGSARSAVRPLPPTTLSTTALCTAAPLAQGAGRGGAGARALRPQTVAASPGVGAAERQPAVFGDGRLHGVSAGLSAQRCADGLQGKRKDPGGDRHRP